MSFTPKTRLEKILCGVAATAKTRIEKAVAIALQHCGATVDVHVTLTENEGVISATTDADFSEVYAVALNHGNIRFITTLGSVTNIVQGYTVSENRIGYEYILPDQGVLAYIWFDWTASGIDVTATSIHTANQ